jgi:putative ATP-binding cassette transporter
MSSVSYEIISNAKDYQIGRQLLSRIYRISKPYWVRPGAWRSWCAFAALMGMITLNVWAAGWLSYLSRDMTNALVAKQAGAFWPLLVTLSVAGLGAALLQVPINYLSSRLVLHWRTWLTTYMTDKYLHQRAYYAIVADKNIDNPDQRIQEEVGPMCEAICGIPKSILNSLAMVGVQSSILLTLSPRLFWITIVVSCCQVVLTIKLNQPTIKQSYGVTLAEADLRYGLLHVRDHAEIVAFYRGEASERVSILARLSQLVHQTMVKIRYAAFLTTFDSTVSSIWGFLPYLLLVPLFFAGSLDFGALSQGQIAAAQITGAFLVISSFIPVLAQLAPHAIRLAQIVEKCDVIHAAAQDQTGQILLRSGAEIELKDVCLNTPGGEISLVQHVSLTISEGQSLLIMGQTGVGKSSLLRAMAGLWTRGSGEIVMPSPDVTFFLPQTPYMTLSDLRTQLLYPAGDRNLSDDELQVILERVSLHNLAQQQGGFSAVKDWGRTLSLGEQQRIAFARVLTNKARYVFLDEATSAVDVHTEALLYGLLARVGCTLISVGHRTTLLDCHRQVLRLLSDGSWVLETPDQARPHYKL